MKTPRVKRPAYGGQTCREYVKCIRCDGTGIIYEGDCDRGCCGKMTPRQCCNCYGDGTKTLFFRAKLQWVQYYPKKKEKA